MVSLILLRAADVSLVVGGVRIYVVGSPGFLIIAILPGGRFCSFCFCVAVFGVMVLKPAATSMLSLFCVLVCVVLAQPTMAIATASTKIIGDLKGFVEPNFGRMP